ncbi:MAG: hypothetical protein WCV55_02635 [Candidatus Paceibacterota bacterium]
MFITAITIFCASFIGAVFLIVNRAKFSDGRVAYVSFPKEWDKFLASFYHASKVLFTELPKHVIMNVYHFIVIMTVDASRKMKVLIYPKISHIVETVRGTNVPEQKKEVSEFLKSIRREVDSE